MRGNRRRICLIIGIISLFLFVMSVSFGNFVVINYFEETIDLNTGKIRRREYILNSLISEEIVKTDFSKLASKYNLEENNHNWRITKTSQFRFYLLIPFISTDSIYNEILHLCNDFSSEINYILSAEKQKKLIIKFFSYFKNGNLKGIKQTLHELQEFINLELENLLKEKKTKYQEVRQ